MTSLFAIKSAIRILAITTLFTATAIMTHGQVSLPATGVINTIAGGGMTDGSTKGYAGDGGPATSATLYWPSGVAVDAAGNFYLADSGNNRIRKVTASTAIITTVAGDGTAGYSGDGGPATSAELGNPGSVAVDAAGNIYIADYQNERIRKVTASTGIITTVAGNGGMGHYGDGDGGPATSAALNWPSGVAVDAAGNLYIADVGNNDIRKVTASTGIITTVAGNGLRGYSGDGGPAINAVLALTPSSIVGVAVDANGNIYIADYDNNRIRKVTASTGLMSTVAGDSSAGYSGDGGPATSASLQKPEGVGVDLAGNIYIADTYNDLIREVNASTGTITTVAGVSTGVFLSGGVTGGYSGDGGPAASAWLNWPTTVVVDSVGNIYIADEMNCRIRVVGIGASPAPIPSYTVTVASSDANPVMGESVALTATILSNTNLPATSGTVTWFNGSTSLGQSNVSESGVATLITTLGSAADQVITANYAGSSQTTGTLSLHVTGFTLTAAAPAVTVTSGQSVQVALNGSAYYGFSGPVDMTCSGMPSPGSCALSASTVNFNNGTTSQSLTLTVGTATATASQSAQANICLSRVLALATLFPLFGLLGIRSKRFRGALMVLLLAVGVPFTAGLTGCGGEGVATATPSQTANGVMPGTYTVTVVAQSGSTTLQTPVTVTVE